MRYSIKKKPISYKNFEGTTYEASDKKVKKEYHNAKIIKWYCDWREVIY
jgi:hypothetical protein